MKKLLIALVLMVGVAAYPVKPDNKVLGNSSSTAPDLELAYKNYISSPLYADYQLHQGNFIGKMNFSGTQADLADDEAILLWINTNLNDTAFGSYKQAVNEFNVLKSKFEKLAGYHHDFFRALLAANETTFANIVADSYNIAQQTDDNCSCFTAYVTAIKGASKLYSHKKKEKNNSVATEIGYGMDKQSCKTANEFCNQGC